MTENSTSGPEGSGQTDFSHSSEQAKGEVDPQVSFTLSLNSAVYIQQPEVLSPPHMIARLILCATVKPPVVLEFFSLQRFDLVIINDAGDEVFRWSAGRAFPMIASNVPVFGKELWTVDVTLADRTGALLPAGHYIAQSFLTTRTDVGTRNPVAFAKKYAASVEFSIENRQEPPV
jgi:Intracellular proteinase inhibitor